MAGLCGLLLLGGCGTPESEAVGAWDFRTQLIRDAAGQPQPHFIEGSLFITRKGDGLDCTLNATDVQFSRFAGMNFGETRRDALQEDCLVVTNGKTVSIQGRMNGSGAPAPDSHAPDSFDLTVAGDRMTGRMSSAGGVAVQFVRKGSMLALPRHEKAFAGLPVASAQKDEWVVLGTTNAGDRMDYQTPIRINGANGTARVWMRFTHKQPQVADNGRDFMSSETLFYVSCRDHRLLGEKQYFKSAAGDVVYSKSASIFGIEVSAERYLREGFKLKEPVPGSFGDDIVKLICA